MKKTKRQIAIQKLRMAAYTDGSLANVCWSPDTKDLIADKIKPHVHSFYEVVFIESGYGRHTINGDPIEVGPGQLFILAPGTSHDPVKLQTASIWVFIFNLQVLDAQGWGGSVFASCGQALGAAHSLLRAVHAEEKQHLVFNIPAVERLGISNLLKRIQGENAEKHTGWEEMVNSFLNLLLIDLMRRLLKNPFLKVRQPHPVVAHAMDFIDLNFRDPILLRDIARHADRSPAYLTSLVNCHTGRPAMAWLSDRRLFEARKLLITSSKSVQQISEAVGYDNKRHVSDMFKRKYGDSPMNWRTRFVG